ncbi:Hypp2678 [Branchiostoma lanceolatum]|uniref:Hypp2678 protein n=1 Tax=Branchiostoma lanceolatum TaxID=7740 RepID=A0A8J9ZWB6_BRALA|nr:Hypp2678 [Branchiostoma lanceolatum]
MSQRRSVAIVLLSSWTLIWNQTFSTASFNVTRTDRDYFSVQTLDGEPCPNGVDDFCMTKNAEGAHVFTDVHGNRSCACMCKNRDTYMSDVRRCSRAVEECKLQFEVGDGEEIYIMKDPPEDRQQHNYVLDWDEVDWTNDGYGPGRDWTCSVSSQRFLEDGKWKPFSCLGEGVPDEFVKVTRRRGWLLVFQFGQYHSQFGGLLIKVEMNCDNPDQGQESKETDTTCIVFKTRGTRLHIPGTPCATDPTPTPRPPTPTSTHSTVTRAGPAATDKGPPVFTPTFLYTTRRQRSLATEKSTVSNTTGMMMAADDTGNNTGLIAGTVIGVLLATVLALGIVILVYRRKRRKRFSKLDTRQSHNRINTSRVENPSYEDAIFQNGRTSVLSEGLLYSVEHNDDDQSEEGNVENEIYEGGLPDNPYDEPLGSPADSLEQPLEISGPQISRFSIPAEDVYIPVGGHLNTVSSHVPTHLDLPVPAYRDAQNSDGYQTLNRPLVETDQSPSSPIYATPDIGHVYTSLSPPLHNHGYTEPTVPPYVLPDITLNPASQNHGYDEPNIVSPYALPDISNQRSDYQTPKPQNHYETLEDPDGSSLKGNSQTSLDHPYTVLQGPDSPTGASPNVGLTFSQADVASHSSQ